MVFKPTRGRAFGVSPVGLPDLSGFSKAANELQNIAGLTYKVGLSERQRKYNESIIQAEADGKTAGSTYRTNDKGELEIVPLTNLSYPEAANQFSKAEKEGVLRAYKKSAITTFSQNLSLDVRAKAQEARLKHPDDRAKIMAIGSGIYKAFSEQYPQEVLEKIGPVIEASFKEQGNIAHANFLQTQRKTSDETLRNGANLIAEQLGRHEFQQPPIESEEYNGWQKMKDDLQEQLKDIYEAMETNGSSEGEIRLFNETLSEKANVITATLNLEKAVQTKIAEGKDGYTFGLEFIDDVVTYAAEQGLVQDLETLRGNLTNSLNKIFNQEKSKKQFESQSQEIAQQRIFKRIYDGDTIEEIKASDDPNWNRLKPSQKVFFEQSFKDTSVSDRIKRNESIIKDSLSILRDSQKYIDAGRSSVVDEAYSIISNYRLTDSINTFQLAEADMLYATHFKNTLYGKQAKEAGIALKKELGTQSSYTLSYDDFMSQVPYLEEIGTIGKDGTWKSVSAFQTSLDVYVRAKDAHLKNVNQNNFIQHKIQKNNASTTEVDKFYDNTGIFKNVSVGGEIVPFDLNSDDENVVNASIDAIALNATLKDNLYFPKSARQILNNVQFTDSEGEATNLDLSIRIIGQVLNTVVSNTDQERDDVLNKIFRINGVTEASRAIITIAEDTGSAKLALEKAEALNVLTDDKQQQWIRNHFPNIAKRKDTVETVDDAFDETVNELFSIELKNGYNLVTMALSSINGKFDEPRAEFIEAFARENNISLKELSKGIFATQEFRDLVIPIWLNRSMKAGDHQKPVKVLQGVMSDIGTRFGFETTMINGIPNIHLVEDPILAHAQATVPNDQIIVNGREMPEPMVRLNEDSIKFDIINTINRTPGAASLFFYEALNDPSSEFVFRANDNYGGRQTYSVTLYDSNGNDYVIADNYSYNFAFSSQNESYLKALEKVNSSKVKRFLSLGGLLDKQILQQTFNNYEMQQNTQILQPLVDFGNTVLDTLDASYDINQRNFEPFTGEEAKELMGALRSILFLGLG